MTRYKEKTEQELREELAKRDTIDETLKEADDRYAIKLVERIVFALVAMILIAFAGILINSAFHQNEVSPTIQSQ